MESSENIEKEIGHRLRVFRESLRISRTQFALAVGIGPERLASYEGGRSPLRYEVFRKIAKEFGLNPVWLVTGEGDRTVAEYDDSFLKDRITTREKFSEIYFLFLEGKSDFYIPDLVACASIFTSTVSKTLAALGGDKAAKKLSLQQLDRIKQSLDFLEGALDLCRKEITGETIKRVDSLQETVKSPGVTSHLARLLKRVQKATAEKGRKKALAEFLGVPPPRVSEWLNGVYEPGAEVALKLLEWVSRVEAEKLKTLEDVHTTSESQRTRSKKHDDETESGPRPS